MKNWPMALPIIILLIGVVWLLGKKRGTSLYDDIQNTISDKRDNWFKHNGKMPDLLLAPHRVYGPAILWIGILTIVIIRIFAG